MSAGFDVNIMSSQRRCGGFTLVEVTVALALVALIAVALFESLRFGQRAHQRIVDRGGAMWQIFASQRLLRSVLESAYPREPTPTDTIAVYGLEGEREKISLLAGAPLAAGGAGLQRYEIMARRAVRGQTDVIVRWSNDLATDAGLAANDSVVEETLIEDIATLEWSYLRGESDEDLAPATWTNEWRGQQQLPRLVRFRVTFARGDPRSWPDLVMVPRVTDDANCAFDVVAQRCRIGS